MTIVVYEWRKYFVTANLAYLLILQYFEYSTISTSLTRVTPERSQKVDSVVYDAKTYASTTFPIYSGQTYINNATRCLL